MFVSVPLAQVSAFLLITVLAVAVGVDGHSANELVEILYVQGCPVDTVPPLATTNCFSPVSDKMKSVPSSIRLSLRGLHFPVEKDKSRFTTSLRIILEENVPPALLAPGGGESPGATVPPSVTMPCENVEVSPIFPTQLLFCDLPNPILYFAHNEAVQQQMASSPTWFDIKMLLGELGEQPGGGRVVSVLRRAVKMAALSSSKSKAHGSANSSSSTAAEGLDLLERFYADASAGADDSNGDVWVELGVGGLKKELLVLFRRVFLSRLPSLAPITEALELQHVRGLILYGPSGNGKTLIARNIARLLGPGTDVKVVSASEVLSKFVGESEKNLRDLFDGNGIGYSAQVESDLYDGIPREASPPNTAAPGLRVLIIDEFEALFRRRGFSNDESSAKAVYDGVTNALLSLMDGIHSRNDMLVIGLTNRLQTIDQALLRPGRFEVLIEIPSPDTLAREEIFFIHTEKLRQNSFLSDEIDLRELAHRSGGFSGSDIAGTVRSAVSHALLRLAGVHGRGAKAAEHHQGTVNSSWDCELDMAGRLSQSNWTETANRTATSPSQFQVTMSDFERAMRDIRTAKDDVSALTHLPPDKHNTGGELWDHDGTLSTQLERVQQLTKRVIRSHHVFAGVVAVSGASGTGKSAVATYLAKMYPFTTVRFVSCRKLLQMGGRDLQIRVLHEAMSDVSRATMGLLILDDVDEVIDYMEQDARSGSVFKSFLYDLVHYREGVGRSMRGIHNTAAEGDADEGSPLGDGAIPTDGVLANEKNRRLLVMTASQTSALRLLSPNVVLRTHAVTRGTVGRLLTSFRIVSEDAVLHKARFITRSYPESLSFRDFIRVTDMALWRLKEMEDAAGSTAEHTVKLELPAFFLTPTDKEDAISAQERQAAKDFYFISDDGKVAKDFAHAVREAVTDMGIANPYHYFSEYHKHTADEEEHTLEDAALGEEIFW